MSQTLTHTRLVNRFFHQVCNGCLSESDIIRDFPKLVVRCPKGACPFGLALCADRGRAGGGWLPVGPHVEDALDEVLSGCVGVWSGCDRA